MKPLFKIEKIPQWEAWGIIVFLFTLEIFFYSFLFFNEASLFHPFSINLLALIVRVLYGGLMLAYCVIRFGPINLAEFIPNGKDAIVLFVALFIELCIFGIGMMVSPEGIPNRRHDSIRELPAGQYWLGISIIVGWVPLLEEALFRRYFLEIQRQHYSTKTAILITASIGALFHLRGSIGAFLGRFFQQTLFSIVYVKSRFGVSVLVHAFVNGLAMFLSR